ncbi:unnamed protein product [Adineta ricciae]|uniref:Uncharacterized protein n=1 Tax=Adineta ricciae TaxID=249248 RepID=A0A816AG51_ADIRI|nr:unnamed protein product [Adineta ricciae]
MPELKLHFDTSILPTDVLSLCDGPFYEIVQKIAGEGEAKLLQVQGIRSVYSFLNTEDVFEILSVPCNALKAAKELVCLEANDKTFMVKPGCRSSVRYLYQLLQQKREEHLKQITKQKKTKCSYSQSTDSDSLSISQDSRQDISNLMRLTAALNFIFIYFE